MPRGSRPPACGARIAAAALASLLGTSALAATARPPVAPAPAAAQPTEFDVKAAFLYNFGKFVEWPEASLPADGTFVIGVVGTDPFGRALDDLEGKPIGPQSRRIVVRRFARAPDAAGCQILFISGSEDEKLGAVLQAVADRPVLTVGDAEAWAERGVMVNFRTRDRKVRFEINLRAAEAAGLKISSQLLKLATLVGGGAPPP